MPNEGTPEYYVRLFLSRVNAWESPLVAEEQKRVPALDY